LNEAASGRPPRPASRGRDLTRPPLDKSSRVSPAASIDATVLGEAGRASPGVELALLFRGRGRRLLLRALQALHLAVVVVVAGLIELGQAHQEVEGLAHADVEVSADSEHDIEPRIDHVERVVRIVQLDHVAALLPEHPAVAAAVALDAA